MRCRRHNKFTVLLKHRRRLELRLEKSLFSREENAKSVHTVCALKRMKSTVFDRTTRVDLRESKMDTRENKPKSVEPKPHSSYDLVRPVRASWLSLVDMPKANPDFLKDRPSIICDEGRIK